MDKQREDSISRTKKVLNMVDGYFYNHNSETRGDLRMHLMDEFDKLSALELQLSAANQRNKELQSENETCRNLMRIKQEQNDAFNQRITELNKRIAELENKV